MSEEETQAGVGNELIVIETILKALEPLSSKAQARIINYAWRWATDRSEDYAAKATMEEDRGVRY